MKLAKTILFIGLSAATLFGQKLDQMNKRIIELSSQLSSAKSDSTKIYLATKLVEAYISKGWESTNQGQYAIAYDTYGQAFELWENPEILKLFQGSTAKQATQKTYWAELSNLNFNYGHLMGATQNSEERMSYYRKAYEIAEKWDDALNLAYSQSGITMIHLENEEVDSAHYYISKAMKIAPAKYYYSNYPALLYIYGMVKIGLKEYSEALQIFSKGIRHATSQKNSIGKTLNYRGLSKAYYHLNIPDSSYFYAIKSLNTIEEFGALQVFNVNETNLYEQLNEHFLSINKPDSAYVYLQLAYSKNTQLSENKLEQMAAFQRELLKREKRLNELEKESITFQSRFRTYLLLAVILVILAFALVLFRNFRQKQKANIELSRQKEEIQQTLVQLKAAQAQLIQSEKMASLGELTAGIAHEIQNPLNFVNNYSEVNIELIEELSEEVGKEEGRRDQKLEIELLMDLAENEQKIATHGKRADAIVRGMLQHSRTSGGVKELTDINALSDEYLRLAYHGLRAKDSSFQADFATALDPNLPLVQVVPQDIGRVLLNIINNAFQACAERRNAEGQGYQPKVVVTSRLLGDSIEIRIQDNGYGIPDTIKDKIFQPFFTTKPAGQGTGLGLSLAYDSIRAHEGTLTLISQQGEGTEFRITLPIRTDIK